MTSKIASILKAKLSVDGKFVLKLRGRCMEPLLYEGDRVEVIPSGHPRIGEVALVLLDDDVLAVHRIVDSGPEFFITKGDYSGKTEIITKSRLLGIAKKFSLEGGPWVEDPREEKAIARIVALSLEIGNKGCIGDNANARKMIWDSNKSTRSFMLGKPAIGER